MFRAEKVERVELKVNKNFLLIKNNINEKNRIKEFSKNEQIIIFLSSIWLYITPSIFFIFSLLFNNSYLCIVICSILSIIISVFILQNTIIRMIQHKPKIINISGVAIANLISFILVLISSQVFDNSYLLKLYFIIIISYYFIVYAIIEN